MSVAKRRKRSLLLVTVILGIIAFFCIFNITFYITKSIFTSNPNVTAEEFFKCEEQAVKVHNTLEQLEGTNKKITTIIDDIRYECNTFECNMYIDSTETYIGIIKFYGKDVASYKNNDDIDKTFIFLLEIIMSLFLSFVLCVFAYNIIEHSKNKEE